MKEKKIKRITKGSNGHGDHFEVKDSKSYWCVDEIKEETKIIGKGYHNDITILTFCGYRKDNKIFEIEANSSLTIEYFE